MKKCFLILKEKNSQSRITYPPKFSFVFENEIKMSPQERIEEYADTKPAQKREVRKRGN